MSRAVKKRSNRRRQSAGKRKQAWRAVLYRLLRVTTALALTAALGGGGWWLNRMLQVESWRIDGVSEPIEIAIEKQLQVMQPLDFVHAWPSRLRQALLANVPDLADVNITRRLPGRLEIVATARQPVAMWQGQGGKVLLVDGFGHAYRPLRAGEMLDMPLLRVSENEIGESVHLLLRLKQLDADRYRQLSEWRSEDDGWRLNFERGRCWMLPRGERAAPRMRAVVALLKQPRWRRGDWRVDARFATRWFIRKSKSGGIV